MHPTAKSHKPASAQNADIENSDRININFRLNATLKCILPHPNRVAAPVALPTQPDMDSDFTATPLATDIHALAAMVPCDNPPDPTELDILQPLMEVCGTEWVQQFLFTEDPVHIPHLTSNTLRSTASIVDTHISRVAASVPQPDPATLYGEHQAFAGRYVFVPAFTVQNITVGVGVVDAIESRDSPWLPDGQSSMKVRLNLRFVHDASKRSLFSLVDLPDQDCVALHCTCVDPFAGPYFLRAMLDRTKLRAVINGGRLNFDYTAVLPALQSFLHTVQYRACVRCGAISGCLCYYASVAPPTHPFDLRHFKTAMNEEFGAYRGITTMVMFDGGRKVKKVTIGGSHTLVQGAFDPASLQALANWSVSQHARNVLQDPRQSLYFVTQGEPTPVGTVGEEGYEAFVGIFGEPGTTDLALGNIDDLLDNVNVLDSREPLLSHGLEDNVPGISAKSTDGFEVFLGVDEGLTQTEKARNCGLISARDGRPPRESESWAYQFSADSVQAIQGESRVEVSGRKSATSNENAVEQSQSNLTQDVHVVTSGQSNVAILPGDRSSSVEWATEIAPSTPSHPSTASEADVDVRALMKKMRDDDRKERNRASARRSNEQNKLWKEEMHNALAGGRRKIRELRVKENAVRKENLRLRKSLKEED